MCDSIACNQGAAYIFGTCRLLRSFQCMSVVSLRPYCTILYVVNNTKASDVYHTDICVCDLSLLSPWPSWHGSLRETSRYSCPGDPLPHFHCKQGVLLLSLPQALHFNRVRGNTFRYFVPFRTSRSEFGVGRYSHTN